MMNRRQPRRENTGEKKGPELLKEVLSRIFTQRGLGRRQARLHLEKAWEEAVGERGRAQTRVAGLRKGVLEIEVKNGVLMQELANFQKRTLLSKLREKLPGTELKELRFRSGNW